eukprot:GDKI01033451.1.p3 GENE.GDKI01033451.1~~GDKI01033451.1.p3  ORF type:complete len:112 (-),score=14.78 GDKI01033451.1:263-598(-)
MPYMCVYTCMRWRVHHLPVVHTAALIIPCQWRCCSSWGWPGNQGRPRGRGSGPWSPSLVHDGTTTCPDLVAISVSTCRTLRLHSALARSEAGAVEDARVHKFENRVGKDQR